MHSVLATENRCETESNSAAVIPTLVFDLNAAPSGAPDTVPPSGVCLTAFSWRLRIASVRTARLVRKLSLGSSGSISTEIDPPSGLSESATSTIN